MPSATSVLNAVPQSCLKMGKRKGATTHPCITMRMKSRSSMMIPCSIFMRPEHGKLEFGRSMRGRDFEDREVEDGPTHTPVQSSAYQPARVRVQPEAQANCFNSNGLVASFSDDKRDNFGPPVRSRVPAQFQVQVQIQPRAQILVLSSPTRNHPSHSPRAPHCYFSHYFDTPHLSPSIRTRTTHTNRTSAFDSPGHQLGTPSPPAAPSPRGLPNHLRSVFHRSDHFKPLHFDVNEDYID
jgi:hypothetical protein